jgi:hypothetical protein
MYPSQIRETFGPDLKLPPAPPSGYSLEVSTCYIFFLCYQSFRVRAQALRVPKHQASSRIPNTSIEGMSSGKGQRKEIYSTGPSSGKTDKGVQ